MLAACCPVLPRHNTSNARLMSVRGSPGVSTRWLHHVHGPPAKAQIANRSAEEYVEDAVLAVCWLALARHTSSNAPPMSVCGSPGFSRRWLGRVDGPPAKAQTANRSADEYVEDARLAACWFALARHISSNARLMSVVRAPGVSRRWLGHVHDPLAKAQTANRSADEPVDDGVRAACRRVSARHNVSDAPLMSVVRARGASRRELHHVHGPSAKAQTEPGPQKVRPPARRHRACHEMLVRNKHCH